MIFFNMRSEINQNLFAFDNNFDGFFFYTSLLYFHENLFHYFKGLLFYYEMNPWGGKN